MLCGFPSPYYYYYWRHISDPCHKGPICGKYKSNFNTVKVSQLCRCADTRITFDWLPGQQKSTIYVGAQYFMYFFANTPSWWNKINKYILVKVFMWKIFWEQWLSVWDRRRVESLMSCDGLLLSSVYLRLGCKAVMLYFYLLSVWVKDMIVIIDCRYDGIFLF